MAGNSRRRGAIRKTGTKKGAVVGSGGQRRRGLEGRGPTPKAADRTGHPAQRRAPAAADGAVRATGTNGGAKTGAARTTGTGGGAKSGAVRTAGTNGGARTGAARAAGTSGGARTGAARAAGTNGGARTGAARAAGTNGGAKSGAANGVGAWVAAGKPAGAKTAGARGAAGAGVRARTGGRAAASASATGRAAVTARRRADEPGAPETVVGRNPVLECLRAGVPATALYVAVGVELDERVSESLRRAADAGVAILEVPRTELDRLTGGVLHQGLGLTVPPYRYAHPDELLAAAGRAAEPALVVALDGVTDPRNLGAVVRSAAAFGAHGVLLPQRRSAGITAVAWRTSAGTATRLPVARATNLTRALRDAADAGLTVVGLDAGGAISIDELAPAASGPLLVVIGGEGRGLSRLVHQTCDLTVRIPMASDVESLNASVAAGVVLAEVARLRRAP